MAAYEGWVWPVELHPKTLAKPSISDGFDRDSRGGVGHYGVDIMYRRVSTGAPFLPHFTKMFEMPDGVNVLSCGPGTVRRINTLDRHGMVVEIDHMAFSGVGLRVSAYRHLASVDVMVGMKVNAGQKIGVVGYDRTKKPHQTPNHLHFELWDTQNKYSDFSELRKKHGIDPAPYMAKWRTLGRNGSQREAGTVTPPFEPTAEGPTVSDEDLAAEVESANLGELAIAAGALWVII